MSKRITVRQIATERIERAISIYEKENCLKETARRRENEHRKMWEVVEYFVKLFPESKPRVWDAVEEAFRLGTKSQYGMILMFNKFVGSTSWLELAKKKFHIQI